LPAEFGLEKIDALNWNNGDRRLMMSIQELEKQLLSLDPHERRRLSQLLNLSLDPPMVVEVSEFNRMDDRTPQHLLRSLPIDIPADFDEPMADLWDALEPGLIHRLSQQPITLYPERDGGYTVMLSDLPGCMSQGDTLEDAMTNIEEARVAWIETAWDCGDEVPLPSVKR
jgi:antitoxin HicB